MANLYQSDVAAMSDDDLRVLSEELEEEYRKTVYGDCGCCSEYQWTDDAAEARYDAMQSEIYRRWEIANPEEAAKRKLDRACLSPMMKAITEGVMNSFKNQLMANRAIDMKFVNGDFSKIGNTITVRRPYRFTAGG